MVGITIGMVANLVASGCVEHLMKQAVVQIAPKTATTASKWMTKIGVLAVSGLIGKAIGDSIDEEVDDMRRQFIEARQLAIETEKRKMIEIKQEEAQ